MFWPSKIPLVQIPRPSLERVMIRVNDKTLTPEELSRLMGAAYAPWLDLENERVHRAICRKGTRLRQKGEFSVEQVWQGSYFQKEIESGYIPDVALCWIDDTLGWGLFANRSFKPREYIAEYSGRVRRWHRTDWKNAYVFEYVHISGRPTPYIIDAREQGGIARYINHSEEGNLKPTLATIGPITHVIFLTDRAIAKGEQLCYNYGPAYWARRKKPVELALYQLSDVL